MNPKILWLEACISLHTAGTWAHLEGLYWPFLTSDRDRIGLGERYRVAVRSIRPLGLGTRTRNAARTGLGVGPGILDIQSSAAQPRSGVDRYLPQPHDVGMCGVKHLARLRNTRQPADAFVNPSDRSAFGRVRSGTLTAIQIEFRWNHRFDAVSRISLPQAPFR